MNPNKINRLELEFIRAYVVAMRREYDLLRSVLDLMDPRNLNVRDVVVASKLAQDLQQMQADFDQDLQTISARYKMPQKQQSTYPSHDALADLFTLSFFKVISDTPHGPKDAGWFSGEPGVSKKLFAAFQNLEKEKLPQLITSYLLNMFKSLSKKGQKYPLEDEPLNHWNLPPNSFTFKNYFDPDDDYDADYDDDEDDDNYFGLEKDWG